VECEIPVLREERLLRARTWSYSRQNLSDWVSNYPRVLQWWWGVLGSQV
jgi:hypothetical protein